MRIPRWKSTIGLGLELDDVISEAAMQREGGCGIDEEFCSEIDYTALNIT